MTIFSATVPARAAVAGNPSDGYGGRVVAVVVPQLEATVTVELSKNFQVGQVNFGHIDRLQTLGNLHGLGDNALFLATLRVAATLWRVSPCTIRWSTTIPRSVGLAGSSALVLATLRALAEANGQRIDTQSLPHLALDAERAIGITAGLQDRVVQTFGGLQTMDFQKDPVTKRAFTQRQVKPRRALDVAVVYDVDSSEPSQVFHGGLRQRYDDGDPAVKNAMRALARAADTATRSIETGDMRQLGAAMNQSFDIRAGISDLSRSHVRLIEIARSCGAPANFAGSGGAIVSVLSTASIGTQLQSIAQREGLGFYRWTIDAEDPE